MKNEIVTQGATKHKTKYDIIRGFLPD